MHSVRVSRQETPHWAGSRKTALRAAVAALACAGLFAAWPSAAQAGGYQVDECNSNTGHMGYSDAVFYTQNNGYNGPVDCSANGAFLGLTIQNPIPISVGAYASWSFLAPAGTVMTSVSFQCRINLESGHTGQINLYDHGSSIAHWETNGYYPCENTAPIRATQLTSAMQCGGTCPQDGGVIVGMNYLRFQMLDETNPRITALGGELLGGGVRHGTEALAIDATDGGSGVKSATISVNGAQVSQVTNACSVASDGIANAMAPCPPGHWSVPMNTELAPWRAGDNTVQVCVFDYAQSGGANSACESRVVVADNACEGSGGTVQGQSIDAGLEDASGQAQPDIMVRSTQGSTVRGTLKSATGDAVPDANVCLYETADAPGQPRELTQIARTKSGGGFSIQVPAGPSRDLDLAYRYNNRVVAKAGLRVGSVVVPTLRLSPKRVRNGRSVHFSGQLPGPNQAGRAVSMQARTGKKWRTFKELKTDDAGRFQGRYRFTQTHGRARYIFRALVKKQGGYPYEPGASAKQKVLVLG